MTTPQPSPWDLEKEAIKCWEYLSDVPPDSISKILAFGRRCQSEALEAQKEKIVKLEAKLTSKCEMHVDYGSPADVALESERAMARELAKVLEDSTALLEQAQRQPINQEGQVTSQIEDNDVVMEKFKAREVYLRFTNKI